MENFNYEVKTFLEAIYDLIKDAPGHLLSGFSGSVTVHDSCHMARELGITEEIRDILSKVEGVNLIEPDFNRRWTTCCGGPGKVLFPELSGKIAARRVGELAATNAELVITFCPYCLAALDKGRREERKNIQLEDFIEFIYRGIAK